MFFILSFGLMVLILANYSRIIFYNSEFSVNALWIMSLLIWLTTVCLLIWYIGSYQIRMFFSTLLLSYKYCMYGWNLSSIGTDLSALIIYLAMLILALWRKLFKLNDVKFNIDSNNLLLSFLYDPLNSWLILISFFKISGYVWCWLINFINFLFSNILLKTTKTSS